MHHDAVFDVEEVLEEEDALDAGEDVPDVDRAVVHAQREGQLFFVHADDVHFGV